MDTTDWFKVGVWCVRDAWGWALGPGLGPWPWRLGAAWALPLGLGAAFLAQKRKRAEKRKGKEQGGSGLCQHRRLRGECTECAAGRDLHEHLDYTAALRKAGAEDRARAVTTPIARGPCVRCHVQCVSLTLGACGGRGRPHVRPLPQCAGVRRLEQAATRARPRPNEAEDGTESEDEVVDVVLLSAVAGARAGGRLAPCRPRVRPVR